MPSERAPGSRWALRASAALGLGLGLAACGPGEAKAPIPTRPLDERRAIEVIRQAITSEGVQPAPGRDAKLASGKPIHIDVGVDGHQYGIAYLSEEDLHDLGDAVKPANKKDEALRIERADDEETRIVLLYQ